MSEEFKAGFARVEITPRLGDPQWTRPIENIQDPIFIRVLYLEQKGGEAFILAMADHGGFDRVADRRIRKAMSKAAGVPISHVRINGSHNHTCPEASWAVTRILAGIGQEHVSLEWLARCEALAAGAAAEARRNAAPSRAFAGSTEIHDLAANRAFTLSGGERTIRLGYARSPEIRQKMFSGPAGLYDPVATVLAFRGARGNTIAAVLNYGCHVTALDQRGGTISADFPGHAARLFEEASGVPLFFLQGAGGNVGTGKYADGSAETSKELGRRLADPALRLLACLEPVRSTPLTLARWTERVELHPCLPTAEAIRKKLRPSKKHQWLLASMLNAVEDPRARELDLFVLRAGDWVICGLPAESMVEGSIALRAASPAPFTLAGAYFDVTLWYIPTFERLRCGGYEATGDWNYTAPGASEQITASMIARMRAKRMAADPRRG